MPLTPDQRLEEIFRTVFELSPAHDVKRMRQLAEPKWDSVAHATLIAAIESEFGISIDLGDALEMTSYDAARLMLAERLA